MAVKILSWNVNGINAPTKRRKIVHWLSKQKASVICLQEVHLRKDDNKYLKQKLLGLEFCSLASVKKRGVVFYIKEELKPQKKWQDSEGRLLAVEVILEGKKVLLVGVYAPNGPKERFFLSLQKFLTEERYENIILMGDFNSVVDTSLDKSSKKKGGKLPRVFFDLIKQEQLVDLWRLKNKGVKDYSFYSARNNMWSRIDMLWTNKSLCSQFKEIEIKPRFLSDHAPLVSVLRVRPTEASWRLNEALLSKPENIETIQREIKDFFKINWTGEIKNSVVWDTFKAYLRGVMIDLASREKKLKEKAVKDLQDKIREKENILKTQRMKKKELIELKILQTQLHCLLNKEIQNKILRLRQKEFMGANKPGRFLAWQMKRKKEKRFIAEIKIQNKVITDLDRIKKAFKDFYVNLYHSKGSNGEKIKQYLKKVNIKKMEEKFRTMLNYDISTEEIFEAIAAAKPGKAPGPDGFTVKFLKLFRDQVTYYLGHVMNDILRGLDMPHSWREAAITLIPKEGLDLLEIKNFRPISLLNADYKIFASILAKRFKEFLNSYISQDQVGFLPNRHLNSNLRILVNALEWMDRQPSKKFGLIFADAEKAFDKLEWGFLIKLLEEFDVGDKFYNAIKQIYTKQDSYLIINNEKSEKFSLMKGTRQGCPISPLLFIFVLETLLKQIQNNDEIEGLRIGKVEFKYRAYADDILFLLRDPQQKIVKLFEVIKEFGQLAGFFINYSKTKIICKNMSKEDGKYIQNITGCEITNAVKYLGIWITGKNVDLFKNNYIKLWDKIKNDLLIWNKFGLSLMGRISLLKMAVLPKLIFLFQSIPIIGSMKVLEQWQNILQNFVWAGKKARIKMKALCDLKENGGLQMPNLRIYFEAACLSWVYEWVLLEDERLLVLEGSGLRYGWHAYLAYEKKKVDQIFICHPIRKALYLVWSKYSVCYGGKKPAWIMPLEVIKVKAEFNENMRLRYEDILSEKHGDLFLKDETALKEELGWWYVMQIKNLLAQDKKSGGIKWRQVDLDKIWFGGKSKLISQLYKYCLKLFTADESIKVQMLSWAKNLCRDISMEEWEFLWRKSMNFSVCVKFKENAVKMLYRWYMTPEKISRMSKNSTSNKCWKCQKEKGTFFHLWWLCEVGRDYWKMICDELEKIYKHNFMTKPELLLLGLNFEKINPVDRVSLWYLTTAARIQYARFWKQKQAPSIENWIVSIIDTIELDRLTRRVMLRPQEEFEREWEKVKKYFEENWSNKNWIKIFC